MAGGDSTQAGISFQNAVASILAVDALGERPSSLLDLSDSAFPRKFWFEAPAPVDDIIVETSADGYCFINVKLGVRLSSKANSRFGSAIEQFVRQLLAVNDTGPRHPWTRRLDGNRDRFILATGGNHTATLVRDSEAVLARIRASKTTTLATIAMSQSQRRFAQALLSQFDQHWAQHTGTRPTNDDHVALATYLRIKRIDPDGIDGVGALATLARDVLSPGSNAKAAFNTLMRLCEDGAKKRTGVDQRGLRTALQDAGFQLRNAPHAEADIARLAKFTDETLSSLQYLSKLPIPDSASSESLRIERAASSAVAAHALSTSFLLLGEPGAGKSGALIAAAEDLRSKGHPVVVIAVDRHAVDSVHELSSDIGLTNSIVDVLQSWTSEKRGIVLIDALDAARGGSTERVFQSLVRDILQLPSWSLVASIRAFDLQFGVTYRDLFQGEPIERSLRHPAFPNVRHLLVPRLTNDELSQIWKRSAALKDAYEKAPESLRELLVSPFNLFLLATILRGATQTELGGITTQAHLLNHYWDHRITRHDDAVFRREAILTSIVDRMLDKKSLTLRADDYSSIAGDSAKTLLSDGVLTPMRFSGGKLVVVGFSHHVLFDYAVARLYFEFGATTDIVEKVTRSAALVLLIAPGANMALKSLWMEDSSRADFWRVARAIGHEKADKAIGAFTRMMPARVAAECTRNVDDWLPLFTALATHHSDERKVLLFLARHALGALSTAASSAVAGNSPWFSIIRRLLEIAANETRYMVRHFLHTASQRPEELLQEQLNDLGASGRLLLRSALGQDYDPSILSVAISVCLRTFATDQIASRDAIRATLEPERFRKAGHADLFWLAHDTDRIFDVSPEGPLVAEEIYVAAFCTPLPSKDEVTNLGNSRLLSLRSNKRQDFEGSRHQLVERFTEFVETAPLHATRALVRAVEHYANEERPRTGIEIQRFEFRGKEARYRDDWSVMWSDYAHNDAVALVVEFKKGISALLKSGRTREFEALLDVIAADSSSAGLWSALLETGVTHPLQAGEYLLPLLVSVPILAGTDTRFQAGELITALHPAALPHQRRTIEQAILATDERTQQVLLTCLSADNVVDPKARESIKAYSAADELRGNTKTFSIESGWREMDKNWWLKEQGVDLESSANRAIIVESDSLSELVTKSRNSPEEPQSWSEAWPKALTLLSLVSQPAGIEEALLMKAWNVLAEVADGAALSSKSPDDISRFPKIDEVIERSVSPSYWPLPKFDPEREASFAKSASWSSPAPRVVGSEALLSLSRARVSTTKAIEGLIKSLAQDPVPEVRYQILSRINMIYEANRELMYEVFESSINNEKNPGVLSGLLSATIRFLGDKSEWIASQLISLDERLGVTESFDKDERLLTQAILRLWIQFGVESAHSKIKLWIADPGVHGDRLRAIATSLRSAVLFGNPSAPDPKADLVRARTVDIFSLMTRSAVEVAKTLEGKLGSGDKTVVDRYVSAIQTLDSVTTEIFFGAEIRERASSEKPADQPPPDRLSQKRRFLREFRPILELLSSVSHANVTHYLLKILEDLIDVDPAGVFRLAMTALIDGGRSDGYHFESLGADLFVGVVRQYIAEYRSVLVENEDLQLRLIQALDVFAEAGWPAARQLVYDLPDMLR